MVRGGHPTRICTAYRPVIHTHLNNINNGKQNAQNENTSMKIILQHKTLGK